MADDRVVLIAHGSTSSQSSQRTLAPAPGVTPPPTDGSSYRFLSDVIIARGLVEPAAMKAALQASLAGRSLTEILVDNGELSQEDLARTLAEHHRLDYVDLDVFAVDHDAAALVEPDVARRFGAVPIAILPSGAVVVALYDPNGSTAVLEFAGLTDRVIQPAVASRKQVEALIASLRRGGRRMATPAPPPAAPAPPEPSAPTASASAAAPRSTHVDTMHTPPSSDPAEYRRSAPAEPAVSAHIDHDRAAHNGHADDALRERAQLAEHRGEEANERARTADERAAAAEERARAAEERARSAEHKARDAEEQTRLAEARARASEERALAAEGRLDAAEARADGLSSAADAANETLARLVRACELLEREAESHGPEVDVLRAALEAERSQRSDLETQLRQPQQSDELTGLYGRIADLERQLTEQRAAPVVPPASAAPPAAAYAPPPAAAPLPPAYAPAPEQAYAPPPPQQQPEYAPPPPPPEQAYTPPTPPQQPEEAWTPPPPPPPEHRYAMAQPEQAYAPPAPPPAPVPEPEPEPQQPGAVVPEAYAGSSVTPTIDIVGEPGSYVPALAPMPSNDAPVKKAPKSSSAKARGLRRLISAIKRGA